MPLKISGPHFKHNGHKFLLTIYNLKYVYLLHDCSTNNYKSDCAEFETGN